MKRNEVIISFLISLGIVAVFFYKFLFFGYIPFPGDLLIAEYNPWKTETYLGYNPGSYPNKAQYFDVLRQLYPWRSFAIDQIREGALPLWNPYNFSGSPLLANFQSAVLYPLNILLFFLPFKIGWGALVTLQPFLALFFTFLYARKIGLKKFPALFAGFSYSFSSFFIVWLEYNTIGHILAWMPFALLTIENLLEKKSRWWMVGLVFSIFSIITAGHIQVAGYVIIFFVAYILFRTYNKDQRLYVFSFIILGIGISAFALFPGFELISQSARSQIPYSIIMDKVLVMPKQWIMFFVSDFFGNPATRNYILDDTYVGKAISIGIIPLLLASLALFHLKTDRFVKFFLFVSVVIILYITKNPITALLFHIPIPFVSSSSSTLSTFLLSFALSMLSGFGMQSLFAGKTTKRDILRVFSVFVVIFIVFWTFVLKSNTGLILVGAMSVAMKELLFATILLMTGGIVMFLSISHKKFLTALCVLLLLVHGVYVFRSFQKFNPFVPQELVFPQASVFSFLQKQDSIQRFWGYKAGSVEANFATENRLYSPVGYDPLYSKRYAQFINLSESGKIASSFSLQNRSDAIISTRGNLTENLFRDRVFSILGVSYVLDWVESGSSEKDFPPNRFISVYSSNGWKIYRDQFLHSRIRLIGNYEVFSSDQEFEKRFFKQSFNPTNVVLLEKKVKMSLKSDPKSSVVIKKYKPSEILVGTSSSTNQLLYVSDTFFPGWKAYVDNNRVEILRANYAFRAVIIPKGKHEVFMKYEPLSMQLGVVISFLSLLVSMIFIFGKGRGIIKV